MAKRLSLVLVLVSVAIGPELYSLVLPIHQVWIDSRGEVAIGPYIDPTGRTVSPA